MSEIRLALLYFQIPNFQLSFWFRPHEKKKIYITLYTLAINLIQSGEKKRQSIRDNRQNARDGQQDTGHHQQDGAVFLEYALATAESMRTCMTNSMCLGSAYSSNNQSLFSCRKTSTATAP